MKIPVRKWLLTALKIFIAIGLCLLLLEILSVGYLTLSERHYVSAKELFGRSSNTYIRDITASHDGCRYIDSLFPHPYLGWVHHNNPPCGIPINNIGLFGDDFPSEKRPDRFTLLLTGGSVAAQFGQTQGDGPGKPKYLEEALARGYVSPNGKPFLVLNGGDGAWKQPQQLILFALYADVVDAVVTLDGFNEHYMLGTSLRLEYPANNFAEVNPLINDTYSHIAGMWIAGKTSAALADHAVLGRSHAAYLFSRLLERVASSSITAPKNRKTTVQSIFSLPPNWDEERRIAWTISEYKKYISEMDAIARDRHVMSAYFIQPVPAIGKTLTAQEQRIVGTLNYRDMYLRMTNELLQLRQYNIPIFDLLQIFETEKETVYADGVHMQIEPDGESRGYRTMAAKIAERLAEAWHLARR